MAFSGEAESLTWQRVDIGLAGASPAAQMNFRSFKRWLANQKLAPQLQYVAFDHTTNGSDGTNAATVICGAAATLQAVYAKKNSGTTLGYWCLSNHATAIQAQKEILAAGTVAGVEFMYCAMNSAALAFATGITYSGVTAYNGTTRSLIADSWDGFCLISA